MLKKFNFWIILDLHADLTKTGSNLFSVSGLAEAPGSGTLGFQTTRVKGGWKTTRVWSRQLQAKYTINHNMIITYQKLGILFTSSFRYFHLPSSGYRSGRSEFYLNPIWTFYIYFYAFIPLCPCYKIFYLKPQYCINKLYIVHIKTYFVMFFGGHIFFIWELSGYKYNIFKKVQRSF